MGNRRAAVEDAGRRWRDVSPAGAEEPEFRDIEAFDGRRAVALAIGEGEASRIFRTEDGGAHWTEPFRQGHVARLLP